MARRTTLTLRKDHDGSALPRRQGLCRSSLLLRRMFSWQQPTLYQRCLAVHIAGARATSALR